MNSNNNKNYKKKIWLNRLSFLLIVIIIILIIVFVIKAFTSRNSSKPDSTAGVIIAATPTITVEPEASLKAENTVTKEPENTIKPNNTATSEPAITDVPATQIPTGVPTQTPDPTPTGFTEISLLSAGDVMCHMPQVRGAYVAETDSYDFNPTFQYVAPIIKDADHAVVNFETTLYNDNYSGYPGFNSPVALLEAVANAGFDTLLFANNHCYDKELVGIKRTFSHFRDFGMNYLGATDDLSKPKYLMVNVSGIRIGMINFADSVTPRYGEQYTVNEIPILASDWDYLNIYVNLREDEYLFDRARTEINALKNAGADIVIAYMHWGVEYEMEPNSNQKKIARKLCDMGVDCIIGSHPHVVQKMDMVKSSDGTREIICFYSLGNYVSNQNRETLKSYDAREYTENGLMVKLFIRKYNDGRVTINSIEAIPTWVHRYKRSDGNFSYDIIPLPVSDNDATAFGLTKTSFGTSHSKQAYDRTMAVISEGIDKYNESHRQ